MAQTRCPHGTCTISATKEPLRSLAADPFSGKPARKGKFTLYPTRSVDGARTWSEPEAVDPSSKIHLCERGCIRSPDGQRMAVLRRENSRRKNSHVIFSDDEGRTWTEPRDVRLALTGDRHTGTDASTHRSRSKGYGHQPAFGDWSVTARILHAIPCAAMRTPRPAAPAPIRRSVA